LSQVTFDALYHKEEYSNEDTRAHDSENGENAEESEDNASVASSSDHYYEIIAQ